MPATPRTPRLLLCCGEPSGDLYGAELVRHLRETAPALEVFGLGGDQMEAQGARLVAHVRELAVVGLLEVVRHLRRLRGVFRSVLDEADRVRPDVAVLIDYPDFNLRLARELKRRGIPVVYYVSPQIWAWRPGRIHAIRANVSRMLVIFPFEEALYRDAGVPVSWVGHPLVDLVRPAADRAAFLAAQGLDPGAGRPLVALLPGSRPQEVRHNLPTLAAGASMLRARRPDVQLALALAPSLEPSLVEELLGGAPVALVRGATQSLVGAAALALVASGTATVETALLGTPMIVVYRLSPLTYLLGRPFVRVPHYAMVNLIAGRQVVPELIQGAFTAQRLAHDAQRLLEDPGWRQRMKTDLAEVRARLGPAGASVRAAAEVGRVGKIS